MTIARAERGLVLTLEEHGTAIMLSERDALEIAATIIESIATSHDNYYESGEMKILKQEDQITMSIRREFKGSII